MKPSLPAHSEKVQGLLSGLDDDRTAMLRLWRDLINADFRMFPLDLLACGAVKRNISSIRAFELMIGSWNMTSARTLLRAHIDTSLRFSAAWLVENPHAFATDVIGGKPIDKMKDRQGNLLRDRYLVNTRAKDYPWLSRVYDELCGYVHFSGSHVAASVDTITNDRREISFLISETDLNYPEQSWVEVLECFREATGILGHYLRGYAASKRLTPQQLAEGRERFLKDQQ